VAWQKFASLHICAEKTIGDPNDLAAFAKQATSAVISGYELPLFYAPLASHHWRKISRRHTTHRRSLQIFHVNARQAPTIGCRLLD
jgi:hypothetical protein